jgi:hypothetical protein
MARRYNTARLWRDYSSCNWVLTVDDGTGSGPNFFFMNAQRGESFARASGYEITRRDQ